MKSDSRQDLGEHVRQDEQDSKDYDSKDYDSKDYDKLTVYKLSQ
jgi:hypothetical protein